LQYGTGPADLEWVYTRQRIARIFPGWTLEYIDSLSEEDVIQIFGYEEGENRWKSQNRK
jgi:hypothetical protein